MGQLVRKVALPLMGLWFFLREILLSSMYSRAQPRPKLGSDLRLQSAFGEAFETIQV